VSEMIMAWCDLVVLGSVQNLPLLLVALLLDRVFVRLAWITPRRVVWAVVVIELLLPPAMGAPVHVAGGDALQVPLAGPASPTWPAVLFVVWALGSLCLAGVSWSRMRRVRARLLDGAEPLPRSWQPLLRDAARRVGLRTVPRVLASSAVSVPCVLGVWRPVVLLDVATLTSRNSEQLEHALLHEFGHIKRRDGLRAWLVHGFVCSWWFHPTAWLAARRFALFRETGCDQLVTGLLGARTAYCHTLAARVLSGPTSATAPALVAGQADVVQRVLALRHAGKQRIVRTLTASLAVVALLMCCVPLTARTPLPFGVASITDVPGCVTKHYYMLSLLAGSSPTAGTPSSSSPADDDSANPR